MRLIDADRFKRLLNLTAIHSESETFKLILPILEELIDIQQTVDIDKINEKIEIEQY